MLRRDYMTDAIKSFTETLSVSLVPAVLDADLGRAHEVERAIGQLVDLDGTSALALSPESLVTMLELSGVADSLGGYVSYALLRVADAYDAAGSALGRVRRDQASAVADAFGWELGGVPEECEATERTLADGIGGPTTGPF